MLTKEQKQWLKDRLAQKGFDINQASYYLDDGIVRGYVSDSRGGFNFAYELPS